MNLLAKLVGARSSAGGQRAAIRRCCRVGGCAGYRAARTVARPPRTLGLALAQLPLTILQLCPKRRRALLDSLTSTSGVPDRFASLGEASRLGGLRGEGPASPSSRPNP